MRVLIGLILCLNATIGMVFAETQLPNPLPAIFIRSELAHHELSVFSKVSDQRNLLLHRGLRVLASKKEQLSFEVSILVGHYDYQTQEWDQDLKDSEILTDLMIAYQALTRAYNVPMEKCGVSFEFKLGLFNPIHKTAQWMTPDGIVSEKALDVGKHFLVILLRKNDPQLLDYVSGNGRVLSTRAVSSIESNLDLKFESKETPLRLEQISSIMDDTASELVWVHESGHFVLFNPDAYKSANHSGFPSLHHFNAANPSSYFDLVEIELGLRKRGFASPHWKSCIQNH